jgi:hypothetical protein
VTLLSDYASTALDRTGTSCDQTQGIYLEGLKRIRDSKVQLLGPVSAL